MNAQLQAAPEPSALDGYHQAAEARDTILARSRELQERMGVLQPLQDKRDAAKAEFDKIMADEAAALTEWAKAGAQGPAPQPDTKARDKAAKALADAEHGLTAAGAAKTAMEGELLAVNESIGPAQAEVRVALAHVLGEEYIRGCERYDTAVKALQADQAQLDTMYGAMLGANPAIASEYVNEVVNHRRTAQQNKTPRDATREGYDGFVQWCRETFGGTSEAVVAELNQFANRR